MQSKKIYMLLAMLLMSGNNFAMDAVEHVEENKAPEKDTEVKVPIERQPSITDHLTNAAKSVGSAVSTAATSVSNFISRRSSGVSLVDTAPEATPAKSVSDHLSDAASHLKNAGKAMKEAVKSKMSSSQSVKPDPFAGFDYNNEKDFAKPDASDRSKPSDISGNKDENKGQQNLNSAKPATAAEIKSIVDKVKLPDSKTMKNQLDAYVEIGRQLEKNPEYTNLTSRDQRNETYRAAKKRYDDLVASTKPVDATKSVKTTNGVQDDAIGKPKVKKSAKINESKNAVTEFDKSAAPSELSKQKVSSGNTKTQSVAAKPYTLEDDLRIHGHIGR